MINYREFRTKGVERSLSELLSSVLASEVLWPSKRLWLVSPWISDIAVLDNSTGAFQTLVPEWERSSVRLSQVLISLARQRTELFVALRPVAHNEPFQAALREAQKTLRDRIHVFSSAHLHEKGMLGDGFYLSGSFNFTFSGIQINEEIASFTTDATAISEARIDFASHYSTENAP